MTSASAHTPGCTRLNGCSITVDRWPDGTDGSLFSYRLNFCPLHAQAPSLLEQRDRLAEALREIMGYAVRGLLSNSRGQAVTLEQVRDRARSVLDGSDEIMERADALAALEG